MGRTLRETPRPPPRAGRRRAWPTVRLGVVIERKNYYRVLAPVVEAAVGQGWDTVCWHDYSQPRGGMKGEEFPAVHAVPRFRSGVPRVEVYQGRAALLDAIEASRMDAVVSIVPPPHAGNGARADVAFKWIALQYTAEVTNCLVPPAIHMQDAVGFYSPWWLEFGLRHVRALGLSTADDATEREIRRKAVAVGFPEVDQLQGIDPQALRRRWRIPDGKPVVAFLPYPFRSNLSTPWSRWAYRAGNRQWKRLRLRLAGARRLESLVKRGLDDMAVTQALRAFCDANGAHLVVKSRTKDPVPKYLRGMADLTLYDEGHYPPTILEVLAVADLCVHFYSSTVLEAAAAGVPSLSICPELDDMGTTLPWQPWLYTRDEGGVFQFRGIAETISIEEAVERLPRMRLTDFTVDPVAQRAYATKFLGPNDGRSSLRLLDVVRDLVNGAGRTS